jgi:hypothetical protein
MKETIDLYAKIVIATFSFIGPSFTLLIPLFYDAIQKSRSKHEAVLRNLQLITTQNLANSTNFADEISQGSKALKKLVERNKRELNLLNPKRQVRRLFSSLFISVLGVGFYYFQHSHFWLDYYWDLKIISIAVSGLSFVYCINVLWQLFCTIIRIKTEDETVKSRKVSLQQVIHNQPK